MNKKTGVGLVLAVSLVLAVVLYSSSAPAMEIRKFDTMADQDQGAYVQLLVDGAQKVLKDAGRDDLAAKVDQLFTEIHQGDTLPLGMEEFENNLALARLADAQRAAKDPSALRLQVEAAMIVTLKKNDIILPKSFMTVGSDFKPTHSDSTQPATSPAP